MKFRANTTARSNSRASIKLYAHAPVDPSDRARDWSLAVSCDQDIALEARLRLGCSQSCQPYKFSCDQSGYSVVPFALQPEATSRAALAVAVQLQTAAANTLIDVMRVIAPDEKERLPLAEASFRNNEHGFSWHSL